MPPFVSGVAAILLRCAAGTNEELLFTPEVQAAGGWHTLTLGQKDLAGGAYGITTRGFTDGTTFRMKPGETLQVELVNDLDPANNVGCDVTGTEFCKAATTNFHTHGLHVSSKGSDELAYASDDVFAEVGPGTAKQYEFSIPDYHMGGTHWYHPHLHHATSIQAGGGAAGALIVDDPAGYLPGAYSSMVEKVLFISGHNLVTLQDIAQDAQSGILENAVATANDAGLATNVFLVNGQLGRTMSIGSHVWHRLRMVYAAVEQTLDLTVTGDATCTLQLLAKDGVYLNEIPRAITTVYLYPGARADVAMSCQCTGVPYPCTAALASQAARRLQGPPGGGGPPGQGGDAPDAPGMDVADVTLLTVSITETVGGVVETLPTTTLDRPCYLADLREATVPAGQSGEIAFNLGQVSVTWNGAGESMNYQNIQAAGGSMSDWQALTSFTTGSVYEIAATGVNAHPMHLHVNPFQIQDMGGSASLDDGYFQAGDWHDTLYINSLGGGNLVTVRMNTDKFTGNMVVHCHILEHEDRGMMGYIELTGAEGAVFAGARALDPSCYDTAFGGTPAPSGADATPAPPTPAPTAAPPTPAPAPPTPAPTAAPPTPAPTAVVEVEADFTADETLPVGMTETGLMESPTFVGAREEGLGAALNVPTGNVRVTGFAMGGRGRRLYAAVRGLTEETEVVSVTTMFTVGINDTEAGEALAELISDASDDIQRECQSAMDAADWSGEPRFRGPPGMGRPEMGAPSVGPPGGPRPGGPPPGGPPEEEEDDDDGSASSARASSARGLGALAPLAAAVAVLPVASAAL